MVVKEEAHPVSMAFDPITYIGLVKMSKAQNLPLFQDGFGKIAIGTIRVVVLARVPSLTFRTNFSDLKTLITPRENIDSHLV
jgi:hypothetical protein